MSSPCGSPLSNQRQHHKNGHIHKHHLKDGYSSLERLNRKPRVNKCSLEKIFLRRASLETMTPSQRNDERSFSRVTRSYCEDSSSDEGSGECFSDNADFIRNRKERSTVLVRRFYKNNQKVFTCRISSPLCICFISSLLTDHHLQFKTMKHAEVTFPISIRWPSQCVLEPERLSRHCHQDASQRGSGRWLLIAGWGNPARRIYGQS